MLITATVSRSAHRFVADTGDSNQCGRWRAYAPGGAWSVAPAWWTRVASGS